MHGPAGYCGFHFRKLPRLHPLLLISKTESSLGYARHSLTPYSTNLFRRDDEAVVHDDSSDPAVSLRRL